MNDRAVLTLAFSILMCYTLCVTIAKFGSTYSGGIERKEGSMADQDKPVRRGRVIQQATVIFAGTEIAAVLAEDGFIYGALPHLCRALGLDGESQRERIEELPALAKGLLQFPLAQGKQLITTWCLRADLIAYWLAIVPTRRMKPEKRARIDFYQNQVGDVLGRLFGTMAVPSNETSLATQNPVFAEGLAVARMALDQAQLAAQRAEETGEEVQGLCCKKKADLLEWKEKNTRGSVMAEQHPFKWRHFQPEIILLCVRWYLRYSLSYRDLEEIMAERGLSVDHTTIYRWVQEYAPQFDKRCRPHLKACNDSWKVDETYIKIKKVWMYLYRAVDSEGSTLEFLLSPTRDAEAAKRFFCKALQSPACSASQVSAPDQKGIKDVTVVGGKATRAVPRVINVDKNAAYPKAMADLKAAGVLPASVELRQVKYLNNLIEQDHRFIKRLVKPGLGFFSLETAGRTLQGYEVMNMMRKGQIRGVGKGDINGQIACIARLFGEAA